ncbi:MAG: hypothetical protein JW900_05705, partial [Anaerolineae bacterium]|nr:hypothetical protein [Anaerolineae bacterium]
MKTRIVTLLVLALALGSSGVLAQPGVPAAPQASLSLVTQFGGPIYRSTLVGHTLYMGAGTHLVVMDVSNPA